MSPDYNVALGKSGIGQEQVRNGSRANRACGRAWSAQSAAGARLPTSARDNAQSRTGSRRLPFFERPHIRRCRRAGRAQPCARWRLRARCWTQAVASSSIGKRSRFACPSSAGARLVASGASRPIGSGSASSWAAICGNSTAVIVSLSAQHHGTEHRIFQLTHIARPGVGAQQLQCVGADARATRLPSSAAKRARKCRASSGMSFGPLAQRRHRNRKHVQAVEQIFAETSGFHIGDQVAVGGGDEAHIDLDRLACADRLDLVFLDGAQQLHLRRRRQLANLVEKQRAAASFDEFSDMAFGRAGEGALLVTEQDRLDQVVGNGAAVDRDERSWLAARRSRGLRARSAPCRRRTGLRSAPGMVEVAAFSRGAQHALHARRSG